MRLDQGGENLAFHRYAPATRHPVEELGLQHVNPGVDHVAGSFGGRRLLDERVDTAPGVHRHHAKARGVLDRCQGDGGHPVPLSVELEQGRNVYLSQDVPVDDDERLVADTGHAGGESNGSRRVQRSALDGVVELDRPAPTVRISGQQGVGLIPQRKHDLVYAMLRQVLHHPLDDRPPRHRQQRLRSRQSEGA